MKVIRRDRRFGFMWLIIVLMAVFALLPPAPSRASSPDAFEDDDIYLRAKVIFLDKEMQRHNFHDAGDQDWVKFYGSKDTWYYIKTMSPDPHCNTVMDLYDAEGNQIREDELNRTWWTGDGEAENIQWQCPKEGTYYLRVSQFNPDAFGEGTDYGLVLWDGYGPDFPGKLEGTIKDSSSGRRITGAKIKLSSASEGSTSLTAGNGAYSLPLAPGTYKMAVVASGYQTHNSILKMENLQLITRDIPLILLAGKASDLTIKAVSGPASAKRDATISVVSMVKNGGQGKAKAFKIGIFLGDGGPVRFGEDRCLGSSVLTGLDAGKTIQLTTKVRIPADAKPGTYYLGALADPGQTLHETKKNNNSLASKKVLSIQ